MRRNVSVLPILLILTGLVRADSTLSDEQLIAQLGASEFGTREAAAKTLQSRGELSLSAMRTAANHADPEIRRRLSQLIARVERATLLSPTLVSLNGSNMPVSTVFEELSRQTGYKLVSQPGNNQPVTVNLQQVPFWQAIDLVCQQTGLGLQPHYDHANTLTFYRIGRFSPYVSYSGPFRISAGNLHLSKTLELSLPNQGNLGANFFGGVGRTRSESLTFSFHVMAEPKIPLMGLGQAQVATAIDDRGNSLISPETRAYEANYHNYYYGYRNPSLQSQIQLSGYGGAETLRVIKGSLPLTFLAEQHPEVTVEKILSVKNKKFDGKQVTLEIDEVKETPNRHVHIRTTIRRNGGENQHDYTWTNSLSQRVDLFDENGQKFQCDGFSWENGTPTSASGTLQFSDPGLKLTKASKLVYNAWVTSLHQVDFHFNDVPLP